MVSSVISRLIILTAGTLYPAYRSYKAVRTKDVKEYVRMMMYWICYALFICVEAFADVFVSFWVPFYYELKIAFVFWLLSPYTRGASYLYRKFIHPALNRHEAEIDDYLEAIRKQSYSTGARIVNRGWGYAKEALANVAVKSQAHLVQHIHKSQSLNDLSTDPSMRGLPVTRRSSGSRTGGPSRRTLKEPVIHEERDAVDGSGDYSDDEEGRDPYDLEFEENQSFVEYGGSRRIRRKEPRRTDDVALEEELEEEEEEEEEGENDGDFGVRVTRQRSAQRQASQRPSAQSFPEGDDRDILLYGTLPRNTRNGTASSGARR